MPVEGAQYINTLQPDWPLGSDPESAGDDHLRMIKQVLQNTFPAVAGAVNVSDAMINQTAQGMRYRNDSATDVGRPDNMAATTQDGSTYTPMYAGSVDVATMMKDQSVVINAAMLFALVYPVGAVFESYSDSRNPADILGFGTWAPLVGLSAGVGTISDAYGNLCAYGANQNGGNGDFNIDFGVMRPYNQGVSVSVTMDQQGDHTHYSGGYLDDPSVARYGVDGSVGGGMTIDGDSHSNAYPYYTSSSGGHVHNLSASGSVQIGTGTSLYQAPYHSAYKWTRTA